MSIQATNIVQKLNEVATRYPDTGTVAQRARQAVSEINALVNGEETDWVVCGGLTEYLWGAAKTPSDRILGREVELGLPDDAARRAFAGAATFIQAWKR